MVYKISSMESAPKDRRIVAYGLHGLERMPSWATVRWNSIYHHYQCDPTETDNPNESRCSLWFDLPQDSGSLNEAGKRDDGL